MSDREHKAKVTTKPEAPTALELDEKGHPISFDQQTEADKGDARDDIAAEMEDSQSIKDPDGEAETPSMVPDDVEGTGKPMPDDPEGQQGGYHE
jgi:hypothetical protein